MSGPFEMVGDPDAAVCEDGSCAVPAPKPDPEPAQDADPSYAEGSPGIV
jgi:hypothetical protein